MMKIMKEPIAIAIGEYRYQLDLDDKASIQAMPWNERKKLIEVLEVIQQVDHVKPTEPVESTPNETVQSPKPVAQTSDHTTSQKTVLDAEVKKSDADIDTVMSRLLVESGPRRQIPDKGQAYKWLGITTVVIILLAALF